MPINNIQRDTIGIQSTRHYRSKIMSKRAKTGHSGMTLSRGVVTNILKAQRGKLFSVTFTARGTGEERTIVGRMGVRKDVNGHGMRYNPADHNAITIWDNGNVPNAKGEKSEGHKTVRLDTINEVRAGNAIFRVAKNS